MYMFSKKSFSIGACLYAYFFYGFAFVAYNNSFLAIALHINNSFNTYNFFILLKRLHNNLGAIRNFFLIIHQYFFTNNLTYKKTFRFISQLLFIIKGGMLRQQLYYTFHNHINVYIK